MVLGGPLPHAIAAKAVALQEAGADPFRSYARRIVQNAAALAEACVEEGLTVLTGGTDNHMLLIDVTPLDLTGRQAESVLRNARITLNRNALPFDTNGAWYTSGLRLGTPALTTLGMGAEEMRRIAAALRLVLFNTRPVRIKKGRHAGKSSKARSRTRPEALEEARAEVVDLLNRYPAYPELDLEYMKQVLQ
jgi:glycine hydroxymethyltransferase